MLLLSGLFWFDLGHQAELTHIGQMARLTWRVDDRPCLFHAEGASKAWFSSKWVIWCLGECQECLLMSSVSVKPVIQMTGTLIFAIQRMRDKSKRLIVLTAVP